MSCVSTDRAIFDITVSINNAVLENLPYNRDTYVKKYVFLDPFLCNFVRPKTCNKLSVNIDDV